MKKQLEQFKNTETTFYSKCTSGSTKGETIKVAAPIVAHI